MGKADERAGSSRANSPDWGQLVLVLIAVVVLSLAGVVMPALGGVDFEGSDRLTPGGDGEGDISELGDQPLEDLEGLDEDTLDELDDLDEETLEDLDEDTLDELDDLDEDTLDELDDLDEETLEELDEDTLDELEDGDGDEFGDETLDDTIDHSSDRSSIGGSVDLSSEKQFTVRADRGSYWRTGVYDRFTGDEWVRTGEREPYDPPITGQQGERVEQVVTAETDIGVMPAAPHPVVVEGEPAQHAEVSEHGQIHPTSLIQEGDSYYVESAVVDPSRHDLRTAGTDYPAPIVHEFEYQQVPDGTSSEFVERTAEITADADDPYEKSIAIQNYLRSSKSYSLEVDRPDGNVAEEFLLEMDEGYCVYFATTMTQMLRTEGVPARYVTGYATGEQVDDEYVVRGDDAHAWVEVYFPDHGWVAFEPTPGDSRAEEHADRIDQDQGDDNRFEDTLEGPEDDPFEDGPEEGDFEEPEDDPFDDDLEENEFGDPEDDPFDDDLEEDDFDDPEDDPFEDDPEEDETEATTTYSISLDDPSPTPGSDVEVTVTDDSTGEPVDGAVVYFNDDRIGTTDANGAVTGTVPFTETLTVSADLPGPGPTVQGSAARGGGGPPETDAAMVGLSSSVDAESESEVEVEVETDAETALEAPDIVVPGTEITVTATVGDSPIPHGDVLIDGEQRTTTDGDGQARITAPETDGNVTVTVERGEIEAERTITVDEGSIAVLDSFPLPGTTADVELSHGDEPIDDATVLVDGDEQATTTNGTATVELPVASETTITGQFDGTTAETTVDGLYRNAAILAVALLGGTVLVGRTVVSRSEITRESVRSLPSTIRRVIERGGRLVRAAGRNAVDAVVRVAVLLERFGYWLVDRGRAVGNSVRRAVRWCLSLPSELADRGLAALAALHPIRLYAFVRGVIRSLLQSSKARANDFVSAVSNDQSQTDGADDSSTESEIVLTLRDLWQGFLQVVRPPGVRTKTPGEIGRYAVDRGFPESPVRTVVAAFRDSEYGKQTPSQDRLEDVRTALRSVAAESDRPNRATVEEVVDRSATLTAEPTATGEPTDARDADREDAHTSGVDAESNGETDE